MEINNRISIFADIGLLYANKRICIVVGCYVRFQHLGGYACRRHCNQMLQKTFLFRKVLKNALCELLLYLVIIEVIFTIMVGCGDKEEAIIAVKSLTYVFMYVYLQNAFRNLIIAYPRNLALRIIYHVIRLEFTRALPSHLQPIIDRLEKEFGDDPDKNNKKKGENENE